MNKLINPHKCPTCRVNASLVIGYSNDEWKKYFPIAKDLTSIICDERQLDQLKFSLYQAIQFPFSLELTLANLKGVCFDFLWVVDRFSSDEFVFYAYDIRQSKEIEKRYERMFQSTTDAVMLLGKEHFTDCNQATLDIFKIKTVNDFIKYHPTDLSPPFQPDGEASFDKANRMIELALEKGRNFFDWMHRDSTGKDFLCEVLLSRIEINGQQYLQASVRDISERVKMQKEVDETRIGQLNAARLASLGEMAGGIAHEINNPMAIIRGQAEFLQRHLKKLDPNDVQPLEKGLQKIVQTVDRITKIIRGLRAVSRDPSHDPMMEQDFVEIIHDTMSLFEEKLKVGNIKFDFEGAEKRIIISCRPAEIAQVILNLMNNSYDSIRDSEDRWIRLSIETKNHNMIMKVADSGPGINPTLANKIFEPFFTTKEVGKGTGLGLSISKSIIERHGGTLRLDEKSPHTTFIIKLPFIKQS